MPCGYPIERSGDLNASRVLSTYQSTKCRMRELRTKVVSYFGVCDKIEFLEFPLSLVCTPIIFPRIDLPWRILAIRCVQ